MEKYDLIINDYIGYPISSDWVRDQLRKIGNKKETHVYINSYGGSVRDALDIYTQFLEHGNIVCHIHGFTASAATIIAMGAKKIQMSKNALFLIHQASQGVFQWASMNADDIDNYIKNLEKDKALLNKVDEIIANIYATKSQKECSAFMNVMKKNEWLNAEEVKDLGLIDEITSDVNISNEEGIQNSFLASGLPIPTMKEQKTPRLLNDILEGITHLTNLFNKKPMENNINLCGIQCTATDDGSTKLSKEQQEQLTNKVTELENSLNKEKAEKTSLEEKIKNLEKQIETLKNSDGDKTEEVIDNPNHNDILEHAKNAKENFETIKDLL